MKILLTSKNRLWPLWLALAVLLGTTLFAACGQATTSSSGGATPPSGTTALAKEVQVKMVEQNGQYAFQPATITISKGTKVTWTNTSDAPHTVTSDTNAFNTPSSLQQNQTYSMTFTTAGTFAYHCSIHTYMKATITVTS
ncbi:MAG TPA: plastocyanin/azurin family copper-binding protein [Ktedonobacteraceae bacterium]|jgi:plastocyanin